MAPKLSRAHPCPLPARYVSDTTVAIFVATLLFIVPSQRPQFHIRGHTEEGKAPGSLRRPFPGAVWGKGFSRALQTFETPSVLQQEETSFQLPARPSAWLGLSLPVFARVGVCYSGRSDCFSVVWVFVFLQREHFPVTAQPSIRFLSHSIVAPRGPELFSLMERSGCLAFFIITN